MANVIKKTMWFMVTLSIVSGFVACGSNKKSTTSKNKSNPPAPLLPEDYQGPEPVRQGIDQPGGGSNPDNDQDQDPDDGYDCDSLDNTARCDEQPDTGGDGDNDQGGYPSPEQPEQQYYPTPTSERQPDGFAVYTLDSRECPEGRCALTHEISSIWIAAGDRYSSAACTPGTSYVVDNQDGYLQVSGGCQARFTYKTPIYHHY